MNTNELRRLKADLSPPEKENKESSPRKIYDIALDIAADWSRIGKGVSPYAKPYLRAMYQLQTLDEMYGQDTATSVVLYFLSNAQGWRGVTARTLKAELRLMLAQKGIRS